jgi:hypothetical protein
MATNSQIATIHTLAGRVGLEGETYRDFLERETGKRSSKEVTTSQAGSVIERLKALAGQARTRGTVAGLETPVGAKLRALWIAGYNLGVVRARDDRAMLTFLERQTGVSHLRFLNNPGASASAIEGLKAWIARAAKVEWPADAERSGGDHGAIATKRAVINAQWAKLIEIGDVKPFVAHQPMADLDQYAFRVARVQGWPFFTPHHYDDVSAALGRKLRGALARRGN